MAGLASRDRVATPGRGAFKKNQIRKKWSGAKWRACFRRGQIKDIVSIRERPAAVEDRAVPGHWEGDLLSGSKNSYIATLVERHTRYVILMKIANKDTQTVISALIEQAKTLPNEEARSLRIIDVFLSDRHRRLFLRSAKSLAARFQ